MSRSESFRRWGVAALTTLILAAAAGGERANAFAPAKPRGLYALCGWNESPQAATWSNPLVDGVVIRTFWKDLNPTPGHYDWAWLDRQFQDAAQHRKQIHLIVAPGFYSPDWVLQDHAVATARFDIPGGPHHSAANASPLPLPWDARYLELWFGFVGKVAERYRENSQLGYVSLTGPNSHNGEMSLPREPADETTWLTLCGADADVLRQRLSDAWRRTIDCFCMAFKGKHVTLAVIFRSLPLASRAMVEDEYVAELVRYGVARYPETFGLQTNGLDGRPLFPVDKDPLPPWALICQYSGQVLVGFQTREPQNLYGGSRRDSETAKRRPEVFRQAMLGNGLSRGPDFIEIYENDANDPVLVDILRAAAGKLKE